LKDVTRSATFPRIDIILAGRILLSAESEHHDATPTYGSVAPRAAPEDSCAADRGRFVLHALADARPDL